MCVCVPFPPRRRNARAYLGQLILNYHSACSPVFRMPLRNRVGDERTVIHYMTLEDLLWEISGDMEANMEHAQEPEEPEELEIPEKGRPGAKSARSYGPVRDTMAGASGEDTWCDISPGLPGAAAFHYRKGRVLRVFRVGPTRSARATVVLLHGVLASHRCWTRLAVELAARGFCCLAPDLLG